MSAMLIIVLPALDNIVCSHDIYSKLTLIKMHDKLPTSDHLPL